MSQLGEYFKDNILKVIFKEGKLSLIYSYCKKNADGIFLMSWQKSLLETHKKFFVGLDHIQLTLNIFKIMLNTVSKINFYIIMSGIKYHPRGSKQALLVTIRCSST